MRIGIVAPGRSIAPERGAQVQAFAALAFPDVDLVVHPQCYQESGHFAGPDAVRAAAFLEFVNDPGFDAIWFARGGYGSNRILATVMPQLGRAARTKTYMGYSDAGFLLSALYAARIGRPVHGPMPVEIGRDDGGASAGRALAWLTGRDRRVLEPGLDGRPAAALNLSILAALIGTPWLADLTDHVLILEDVSEPLYRIDRMMFTVGNATQLKGIAGIRLGEVNDIEANNPEFAETPEQIVQRWARDLDVPYLGRAQVGHYDRNMVVPFGVA